MKQSTILLVDDNPMNLGVLADYLESQNFVILVARDGESALEKAAYALPDIILLDVMMPGLDGFETCRLLKENELTQKIPVIFMTALAETTDKVRGFNAGAVDYVTKPLQQDEVLARVNTHLRLRELTDHLETLVQQRTAELDAAYHRLERLDRAKSDFITVISHELRTPLTIIDGYTQLLRAYPEISGHAELQERVTGILRGTQRMLEIINLIMEATRIDQGSTPIHTAKVTPFELYLQARMTYNSALRERNISITPENVQELPEIEADPNQITRVLTHLLGNAIKYTPDGGQVFVRGCLVSDLDEPAQIEISIQDSGIGINPDEQDLVFEKFYHTGQASAHSSGKTSFKAGGPGLGLTIARGIVLAHHGKIWVESPGYNEETLPGSTFHVRLPLKQP